MFNKNEVNFLCDLFNGYYWEGLKRMSLTHRDVFLNNLYQAKESLFKKWEVYGDKMEEKFLQMEEKDFLQLAEEIKKSWKPVLPLKSLKRAN